jgi:hypothetical protein
MSTMNITTGDGLFCIYQGDKLYSVLQTTSGSTVSLSTTVSYVEHATAADLSAWMASNNISSKTSSALFHIRRERATTDNTAVEPNPVYEPLRVAASMPTGTEGIVDLGDLQEIDGPGGPGTEE